MTRDEMQQELRTRLEQLREINSRSGSEGRDLTNEENDEVAILRSEIARLNLEVARPTQPERREPATAPYRDQVMSRSHPDGNEPWGGSLEGHEPIQRVAHDIAEAVREGRSIQRAITLPVGFVSGGATAGDPLDVVDLAQFFTTVGVDGTRIDTLRMDATDAPVVPEGQPKPDIVTGTLVSAPAQKIAGMGIVTTEGLTFAHGAQQAITNVLRGSIIAGQNREIMNVIEADGTPQAFVTDAITTILTAMATVGSKAQPSVVVAHPSDYVGLVLQLAALPQNIDLPRLVVSDDATASSVTVAARSGVQVARTQVGILVDPYTLAHENKTRLVAEMFVAVSVVRPGVVVVADTTAA